MARSRRFRVMLDSRYVRSLARSGTNNRDRFLPSSFTFERSQAALFTFNVAQAVARRIQGIVVS